MKGILFNTEMVQAILAGRKTQTRRPIDWDISNSMDGDVASGYFVQTDDGLIDALKLYRYQKGDILYVRETFANTWTPNGLEGYVYKADGDPNYFPYWGNATLSKCEVWRPSIHMPKEAARIFLKVTDVRVERVQDINPENSIAEGFNICCDCKKHGGCYLPNVCAYLPNTFKKVWDKIYESKGYGWDTNCWVWIIEFERCEKPDEN